MLIGSGREDEVRVFRGNGEEKEERNGRASHGRGFCGIFLFVLDEVLHGAFLEIEKDIFLLGKISLGGFLHGRERERWEMREEGERVEGMMGKGLG